MVQRLQDRTIIMIIDHLLILVIKESKCIDMPILG